MTGEFKRGVLGVLSSNDAGFKYFMYQKCLINNFFSIIKSWIL